MNMIQDLNDKGIRLKNYGPGNYKTTCPRCSHTRRNKTDPCLSVTVESDELAVFNCHHCFWKGSAGNVTSRRQDTKPKEYKKPEQPKQEAKGDMPPKVLEYLKGRAISPETIKRNRVFWNAQKSMLCFPYYVNGELVNIKSRSLDKKFSLERGAQLTFYGLDDVKGADEIIIVEGEFDKLALEECGMKNVLSVPNGAPARVRETASKDDTAFSYLNHAEDTIHAAKKIILAVDDDKAGENLRYELARRIGAEKCYVAKFPEKDANGCLKALGVDIVLDCLRDATPYPIAGLYEVNDFQNTLIEFFDGGMASGVPTGWENVDRLYTVMPGELTVITGVPNSGKSEFLDALMVNLAKNEDWNFAVFSPENGKEGHVAKLSEKIVGLPIDPRAKNRMTKEEFLNGASWVGNKFYFIVADDAGKLPTVDWILEKARSAVFRYGVKGIVIDPYNEIEHDRKGGQSESEFISEMLSKIKRFARNNGVHVWMVAHPTKMETDKDGKLKVPSLYNISGSANWVNKTDNGIVIHRSEDASDTTEVWVKKIRFKYVGKRGKVDLRYDKNSGRYSVPVSDLDLPDTDNAVDEDIMSFEVEGNKF
jgi:twinkle protein